MTSNYDYDGLCGRPGPAIQGTYLRCRFKFDHGGLCSWDKHRHINRFGGGCTQESVIHRALARRPYEAGSPAAEALLDMFIKGDQKPR